MIYKWFIRHQWKEMIRASIWQKSIILNIVLGLVMGILLLNFLVIGLFIDKILLDTFPGEDPYTIFCGALVYYLGFELFMRFMLQNLPVLNIETYLHLPIKKSAILHYVSGKSIVAFGNYLPLLIVAPFAFKVVAPAYGTGIGWVWLLSFMILVFANNFLATYLKRQLTGKASIVGMVGVLLIALVLLDYFEILSLSGASAWAFTFLVNNPWTIALPVVWMIFTYSLNYLYLKGKLYPDEVIPSRKSGVDSLQRIQFLESRGITGQMILLDLRLIWRHKRTRSIVWMAPIYLLYGLLFYTQEIYMEQNGWLIFVGIFMTGGMMMGYANYSFGYESNYFDNILANYKDYLRYLKGKYYFAVAITTVCYILTIPYVFFGPKILLINTMTFLYNVGVLTFLMFYLSTYSAKRMDLSKGAAFNYQGLGASHWLSMVPAFLLPILVYWPLSAMGYPTGGLILIGSLGLVGILFNKTLLNMLLKQFLKKKYSMAEGFRE